MAVVIPQERLRALLAVLQADVTILTGSEVHLYKNDYAPTKLSVVADFEEADFSGYVEETAAWEGIPYNLPNGQVEIAAETVQFNQVPAEPNVTNTVYGWYLLAAGGQLLAAERFESPKFFAVAGDSLAFAPLFQMRSPA